MRKYHSRQEMDMKTFKKAMTYLVITLVACVGALNYQLFVFPNQFAPSGLNGLCTMIQHVFGISVGYMSLLVNIPLSIVVYFKVSKTLALRSMVYIGVFSVMLLLLDRVDLSGIAYDTASSAILGPLSTCVFGLKCGTAGGGMGTSGLVGIFDLFKYTNGALGVVGILLLMIVLPALLNIVFSEFMRKKGWIKDGDMKLPD